MTPEKFKRTIDEFFFLNGALNVGDFVPWLDRLDLQGYVGRMRRAGTTLHAFIERVLDEHAERRRQLDGEGFAAKAVRMCCWCSPTATASSGTASRLSLW